jgi:hypothetical protein
VVEKHLQMIGMIANDQLDVHQKKMIQGKLAEYESRQAQPAAGDDSEEGNFPPDAQLCKRCTTKSAIVMDGRLNCGDSKCN